MKNREIMTENFLEAMVYLKNGQLKSGWINPNQVNSTSESGMISFICNGKISSDQIADKPLQVEWIAHKDIKEIDTILR